MVFMKRKFRHVEVRQELFVKDVLRHVPYIFSVDADQEYKVHRFTSLVNGIFSVAQDQTRTIVLVVTIIVGISVGSGLDLWFLVFMTASTIFSAFVKNRQKIKNLKHENGRDDAILWERANGLSEALDFPSLGAHLSNQMKTLRDLFVESKKRYIDRSLERNEATMAAESKTILFDLIMKGCILAYVVYSIKRGRMIDVIATYYVASMVTGAVSSLASYISGQAEVSQKLSFVAEIMKVSQGEKARDEARVYPDVSRGVHIELRDVSFRYPGQESFVLHGVNLQVTLDEFFALEGANGAGKTTLFKIITGYLPPTSGSVIINGVPVGDIKRAWFADTFASYSPEMEVTEMVTVEEFLTVDGLASSPDRLGVMRCVLSRVGLEEKFNGYDLRKVVLDPGHPDGTDLSSGQKQRLLIARMVMNLIAGAKYVLADEMTSNITFHDQAGLIALLRDYARGGIVIAHNPNMLSACDRVLTCSHGTVNEKASEPAE